MLKAAFAAALKRYSGLVAAILMINAASEWRHNQHISVSNMLVALAAGLTLFFFVAVPFEFRKPGKSGSSAGQRPQ